MEYILVSIPNDYSYKKTYLDKHSSEIEVLVLGSSHSFFGIDPIYFKKNTFNASHISQSLDFDNAILCKYKDRLNKLETIILPISYFSLWSKLENGSESWRVKNYQIYYHLNSKSLKSKLELFNGKNTSSLKRVYEYYKSKTNDITVNQFGWGTTYSSVNNNDLIETGLTASKRHTKKEIDSGTNKKIFDSNINYISQIIDFCYKNGVNLIFITIPTHQAYFTQLDKHQLSTMINTVKSLTQKNSHINYLNWLNHPDFQDVDFYDADHLNEIGAEKLSVILSDYVDTLNISHPLVQ